MALPGAEYADWKAFWLHRPLSAHSYNFSLMDEKSRSGTGEGNRSGLLPDLCTRIQADNVIKSAAGRQKRAADPKDRLAAVSLAGRFGRQAANSKSRNPLDFVGKIHGLKLGSVRLSSTHTQSSAETQVVETMCRSCWSTCA